MTPSVPTSPLSESFSGYSHLLESRADSSSCYRLESGLVIEVIPYENPATHFVFGLPE